MGATTMRGLLWAQERAMYVSCEERFCCEDKMILAAAQTKPKQGDIDGNLADHYRLIEIAHAEGANLLVFPEMSLTGYERENANKLSFAKNDSRLDELRILAVDHKMVIAAGAPIMLNSGLYIGSFILHPDGSISIYSKQFLHVGEEEFYKSSFDHNPLIGLGNDRISLAICADIDNPLHPENAWENRSTIYVASIFYTPKGIAPAHDLLRGYAEKYSMNILLANYSGKSWGLDAGGKSAFWTNRGNLIAALDGTCSGLLVVENNNGIWTGKKIIDP
jgi:predicted amidohydrolase